MTERAEGPVLIDLSHRDLAAIIAVLLLTFASAIGMAFNIGAMVASLGATAGQAGQVATIELACVSIASFVTSRLLVRFSIRQVLFAGVTVTALANALTVAFQDIHLLLAWRGLGGLGEGVVIAGLMGLAGRSKNPEMTFGLINGSIGIGLTVVSFVIPWAINGYGLGGAYSLYLAFGLLAFGALPFVPRGEGLNGTPADGAAPQESLGLLGWLPLFGLGLLFLGHNALMAFAERIGNGIGLQIDQVGIAIAIGGLLTIIGPISAGMVGARYGSLKPVLVFIALLVAAAYVLATVSSASVFFAVVPVFMLLPLTLMPFFLGGLAALDPSGRLVAANPAFVTMGGAIGPVIGGYIADVSGFFQVGLVSMGLFLLGAGLMIAGLGRADQLRLSAN